MPGVKNESISDTSRISAESMRQIIDKLKTQNNRGTTRATYFGIWRKFNKFLIRLDELPATWEERTSLYIGHLFKNNKKSTTVKTYVSAIKSVLAEDDYEWNENEIKFAALTRGCKLSNDRVKTRLPIGLGLLEIILDKIQNYYDEKRGQVYLSKLYQCILILGYYGLMRIGELTKGNHPVKAKDVHASKTKRKIMMVLFTSKTHGVHTKPQEIRMWSDMALKKVRYCPFRITNDYGDLRGGYISDDEQFFVFQDKTPVTPQKVRAVLRKSLKSLGLNPRLYDTHSLRIGRASDLMKAGVPVDRIKQLGRWKSNAVFRYLR